MLIWRAVRWRAGSSAMFFAVAIAAIMSATAGPIYLRAADQSLVAKALASAPVVETGLTLTPESGNYRPPRELLDGARSIPGGGRHGSDLYGSPITTVDASGQLFNPLAGRDDTIDFVYRTWACARLDIVSGHCPRAAGEVVLSTRTARAISAHLGGVVHPLSGGVSATSLRIVGLFMPRDATASYWWGGDYFAFGTPTKTGEILDDGFMSESGATALAPHLPTSDWLQVPLRTQAVQASAVPGLLSALDKWSAQVARASGIAVATRLGTVAARGEAEEHLATTIVTFVSLQLVLLALLVLYSVARATSALRATDVRVAELRGLPRRRIARLALREPTLLLLAALPIGIGLTYALLSAIDGHVLGAGSSTTVDSLALGAAVLGCLAGLVSVVFGSRGLLTGDSSGGAVADSNQRRNRNTTMLDALGIGLAIAGVAELVGESGSRQGRVEPIAYLGPGLVALGAAILAARLLPLAGRLLARAYEWSSATALTLAARALARKPALCRQVLIPSIATGLLVFGVAGLAVARTNHLTQADFTVGAPVVLKVQPRSGVNVLTAVRKADPGGKEAMAAALISANDGVTLALDSSRLAAIASWPTGLSHHSVANLAARLDPKAAPERVIAPGSVLRLLISSSSDLSPRPEVSVEMYQEAAQGELTLSLGEIRPGTHTYATSIAGDCPTGCRLDEFLLDWSGPTAVPAHATAREKGVVAHEVGLARHYSFRLVSMATATGAESRPLRMDFSDAADWQAGAAARATASASGLEMSVDFLTAYGEPTLSPVDLPRLIPAVATGQLVALDSTPEDPRAILPVGLDGGELPARADVVVPALPRVGSDAAMIDLGLAERAQSGPDTGVSFEVWCKQPPSASLLGRFRRDGLRVLSIERASSALAGIEHSGPSFGFDLYALAAIGSVVLALGTLLSSISSAARERRIEFAGLSAVGVPLRTLRRSLFFEATALSLAGAIAGTAAAAFSASIALRFLPEFPPGRIGPPLALGLPWLDVLATGAAMFVLLELAAVLANFVLVRGVTPALMRLAR